MANGVSDGRGEALDGRRDIGGRRFGRGCGRRHGANANEVFHWRKLYQSRLLELQQHNAAQLLPVTMVDEAESGEGQNASAAGPSNGAIHIELPGRALVSAEGRVEAPLARAVLENLLG